MTAVSRQVAITNQRGLHARASAKFVNLASQIDAKIEVEKDGHRVCGTSIMGLMMLGAAMGDNIVIHVEGDPTPHSTMRQDPEDTRGRRLSRPRLRTVVVACGRTRLLHRRR